MYTVKDFLEKNRDHQQDMLFDFMEASSIPFVKELTRFRVSNYLCVCACVCVCVCVCMCIACVCYKHVCIDHDYLESSISFNGDGLQKGSHNSWNN